MLSIFASSLVYFIAFSFLLNNDNTRSHDTERDRNLVFTLIEPPNRFAKLVNNGLIFDNALTINDINPPKRIAYAKACRNHCCKARLRPKCTERFVVIFCTFTRFVEEVFTRRSRIISERSGQLQSDEFRLRFTLNMSTILIYWVSQKKFRRLRTVE